MTVPIRRMSHVMREGRVAAGVSARRTIERGLRPLIADPYEILTSLYFIIPRLPVSLP